MSLRPKDTLPRWWFYGFTLLAVLLALFRSSDLLDPAFIPRWTALAVFTALMSILAYRRLSRGILPLWPSIFLLVFIAAQALSLTGATSEAVAFAALARYGTWGAFGLLLFLARGPKEQILPRLLLPWSILGALAVLPALFQVLSLFGQASFAADIYEVKGLFSHKNLLASILMLSLPLVLAGRDWLKPGWQQASLVLAFLLFVMIFILRTRGVWLGTLSGGIAAALIFATGKQQKEAWPWSRILIASGIATFLIAGLLALPSIRAGFLDSSNIQKRFTFWNNSWQMIQDHPLVGIGSGNWKLIFPKYGLKNVDYSTMQGITHIQRPHNDYLWIWSEAGPLALLAFLGLLGWGLRRAYLNYRNLENPAHRRLQLMIIWALVSYAVFAAGDFPLERAPHTVILLVLLGLAYWSKPEESKEATLRLPGIPIFILAIVLGSSYIHFHQWKGEKATQSVLQANAQQNAQAIIPAVRKALNPYYQVDPYANPLRYYSSLGYLFQQKYQRADKELLQALEQTPYNILVHFNRANVLRRTGKPSQALEQLNTALRIAPYFERARLLKAELLEKEQRWHDALETINLYPPTSTNRRYQKTLARILRGSLQAFPEDRRHVALMQYLQKQKPLIRPLDYVRAYRQYRGVD